MSAISKVNYEQLRNYETLPLDEQNTIDRVLKDIFDALVQQEKRDFPLAFRKHVGQLTKPSAQAFNTLIEGLVHEFAEIDLKDYFDLDQEVDTALGNLLQRLQKALNQYEQDKTLDQLSRILVHCGSVSYKFESASSRLHERVSELRGPFSFFGDGRQARHLHHDFSNLAIRVVPKELLDGPLSQGMSADFSRNPDLDFRFLRHTPHQATLELGQLECVLKFDHCQLQNLSMFQKGHRYQVLSLRHNQIRNISSLHNVTIGALDLSHNPISTISSPLPYGLYSLNLSHTPLEKLPDNLPTEQFRLNISHTRITSVPDQYKHLVSRWTLLMNKLRIALAMAPTAPGQQDILSFRTKCLLAFAALLAVGFVILGTYWALPLVL